MAIAKLAKIGYGQIEPNRLSAQKTREVYAQLPMADTVTAMENGMAVVYDEVAKTAHFVATAGARAGVMMNENTNEDERYQMDADFVLTNADASKYQGAVKAYPRVYALHVGDTFTTNVLKYDATTPAAVGDNYIASTDGYWVYSATVADAAVVLQVTDIAATLPDGQAAFKFVVVKA